ncbi:hypothetical protein B0H11DRAFT_2004600 [Mycena galericulata]|nr:hypothetical protein B0H11DRAFT_2004600 [Mycena galericulata]
MPKKLIGPVIKADLTGKVVCVIGANTGVGFEAAKHFATMNPAKVILGCRSLEKGQAALNALKRDSGFQNAEVGLIDLASFASVQAFAKNFASHNDKLHYLVLNAAVVLEEFTLTDKDGYETMVQVDVLSQALLSLHLLPQLFAAASASFTPRVVVVTSGVHGMTTLDDELIQAAAPCKKLSEQTYEFSALRRYSDVKLFNIFFARELQARLLSSSPALTVHSLSPGNCISELNRNMTGEIGEQIAKSKQDAYTTEEGSRSLIFGALGGKEEEMKGTYSNMSEVSATSEFSNSEKALEVQKKLWDEIMSLPQVDDGMRSVLKQYLEI